MKQEFLPKLARGEILMAFGVTEPTAGVDTSRIQDQGREGRRRLGRQRSEGLDQQRAERR